jgi:hypothetical protein
VISVLCARKSHDQYAPSHPTTQVAFETTLDATPGEFVGDSDPVNLSARGGAPTTRDGAPTTRGGAAQGAVDATLVLSCAGLRKRKGSPSKDTVAAVYVRVSDDSPFELIGTTEVLKNELEPSFKTPIDVTIPNGGAAKVRVFAADFDGVFGEDDCLGDALLVRLVANQIIDAYTYACMHTHSYMSSSFLI